MPEEVVDVVVVGFGMAGAAAALQAKEDGAHVVVLDRFEGGGTTSLSGGVFYAGGGTPYQRAAGVDDTTDAMHDYLAAEIGDVVSDATLRRFCEGSLEMLEWLEGHGVPFDSTVYPYKTAYPPDGYFLYYSGSEDARPFADVAPPAQRGHRAKGEGHSGALMFAAITKSAERLGIEIRRRSRVVELLRDPAGRVVGVEYRTPRAFYPFGKLRARLTKLSGKLNLYAPPVASAIDAVIGILENAFTQTKRIKARNGVVLACGGYAYNKQMVRQHAPQFEHGRAMATLSDDGSGIRLGQSVGAAASRMDSVSGWRWLAPPHSMQLGVLVGPSGRRVCNEEFYSARVGTAIAREHNGRAWLIHDKATLDQVKAEYKDQTTWFQRAMLEGAFAPGGHKAADTVAELARKCGIDEHGLVATIRDLNRRVEDGAEDSMGKKASLTRALVEPPFVAIDCGIKNRRMPFVILSMGGLLTDEESGLVLDDDGDSIAGLYAAGRTAVSICSASYVSGLSLSDCVFSGRRAGRHAAKEAGRA